MTGAYDIYRDNSGKFRWCLKSGTGQRIAFTEQAYDTKAAAITATKSARRTATGATITDHTA